MTVRHNSNITFSLTWLLQNWLQKTGFPEGEVCFEQSVIRSLPFKISEMNTRVAISGSAYNVDKMKNNFHLTGYPSDHFHILGK